MPTNEIKVNLNINLKLEAQLEDGVELVFVRGAQSEVGAGGLGDRTSERDHRKGKEAKENGEETRVLHGDGESGGEATREACWGWRG